MKTSFKANLLQHLIAKKEDGGFTLIELLVVIIIIGILAAIALPSFLNQANRARQSEAVTYVGSVNRAQQAFRLENPEFSDNIPDLGLGIQDKTDFYEYAIPATTNAFGAVITATPKDPVLLGYSGITYTLTDPDGNATTTALLCKGEPNVVPALTVPGAIATAQITCPAAPTP